jgi:hypothetical protein
LATTVSPLVNVPGLLAGSAKKGSPDTPTPSTAATVTCAGLKCPTLIE